MTSISSATSFHNTRPSPRERLQDELTSEIASGAISSGDQDALSTALDSIDQSLSAERSSSTGGQRLSPQDMQKKIEGLVDQQVSSGQLTSDQASELKQVFQNTFAKGHEHGHHDGAGGPGGAGGTGAPPPPADGSASSDSSDSSSSSSTDAASLISDFLKQLQDNVAKAAGYAADGSKSSSAAISLMVDQKA